ncbi:MAG: hypothetical protein RR063_11710 [Anaerovoracaceae bacterium]
MKFTNNYVSQKKRMGELSVASLCRAVDLINLMRTMIDADNEIQDEVEDILKPLYDAVVDLRVDNECPLCGMMLYKSDLPQYEFVCPCCEENF